MTENMIIAMQAIQKFAYYNYNFEYNFVKKVWGNGALAEHLQSKFNYMYEKYGAMGALLGFYAELDGENKKKLLEHILTNFDGEQKLSFK